jgi:hypothetical protein
VRTTLALLAALLIPALCGGANAQSAPDADVCKNNPTSLQCLTYSGAKSISKSQSGIVGSTLQERTDGAPPKYAVFIHASPAQSRLAGSVKQALSAKGYIVRGIDDDQDLMGGPAVDYFREEDRTGAADVAEITNKLLPKELAKLEPRRQRVSNPPGFIGLWLPTLWLSAPPNEGWCAQQIDPVESGSGKRYLVRCYETQAICEDARGLGGFGKSECVLVKELTKTDWKPQAGGRKGSWYSSSPTQFGPPFPAVKN